MFVLVKLTSCKYPLVEQANRVRFLSVVTGLNLETLLGLSLGTEDTAHNYEVSVKWVSTVISFLFWTVQLLLQCQVYFYTRVTLFLLSIFVEQ